MTFVIADHVFFGDPPYAGTVAERCAVRGYRVTDRLLDRCAIVAELTRRRERAYASREYRRALARSQERAQERARTPRLDPG